MNKVPRFEFRSSRLAWCAILAGSLLAGCGGGGGDGGRDPILGGGGTAVLTPLVTSVTPLQNATGVPVNTAVVTATFNKAMDASTLTASTFSLACPGGTAIAGAVTYAASNNVATLTLANNLPGNTTCTATVAAGVRDATGNAMAAAHVWNFNTGAAADAVAPVVSSTVPLPNATGVAVDRRITASFSEAMNPLTITAANFSLTCPAATVIGGTVEYTVVGNVLTFKPTSNLPFNTACRATISTGVRDVAGNAMKAPFSWNFTTSATLDTTAPTVISSLPRPLATGVALNSLVSATFSEAMLASSISASQFTVECPAAAPITGTVGYAVNGNTATFTPNATLPGSTVCRGTIKAGVKDLAGLSMASDYVWTFTTGPVPDTTAPVVSATDPLTNATAVRRNTLITASFSEVMNPLTITRANYSVDCPAGVPIEGVVAYSVEGSVAMFAPVNLLPPNVTCRATITNAVKDVAGNAMVQPYSWIFTTGVVLDATAPQVELTVPTNNQTDVLLNTQITARFTESMDPFTITQPGTYTVACPIGTPVNGIVSYAVNSRVASFAPNGVLPASTQCRATITNTVKDIAGNAMLLPYSWNFTTGVAPDTSRPTITLVVPDNLATNVPLNQAVSATFSEPMNPLSISTASFTLSGVSGVSGLVTYNVGGRIATFTPNAPLASGTTYTATVTTGVSDLAGNGMASNRVWTFSTGTGLAPGAVALGDAGTFGIMATAAITSTGATMINGDVSLNPGTSQGIPPPQVNGTIHINDSVSVDAKADLLAAYNFAKALPPGVTIAAGADLGALYPTGIPPGTYTSGSTMLVSTPLTLDAGGDPNAVWVFQIGSSLTTTASVLLSPAAQAKNVFWVPTQDATIGVGTTFNGTIVAGRDTTGQTGAIINGRILSGAITAGTIALDSNTVNVPAP